MNVAGIDKILEKCSISPTTYLGIVNFREEEERFFREKTHYRPRFKYPPIDFSPRSAIEELEKTLKYHENKFSGNIERLYENKLRELILIHHMLLSRGTPQFLEYSIEVYGKPSRACVKRAIKTVEENLFPAKEEKSLSPQEVVKMMEDELKRYELHKKGWKIQLDERDTVNVDSNKKVIQIPKNRKFSEREVKKLVVHEICCHVFRRCNGELQPFGIFKVGFPRYLKTEEGLAFYLESVYNVSFPRDICLRAAYVVAIDKMLNGHDFYTVWKELVELGINEHKAFLCTARVFRGGNENGGFTKDYVYFAGREEIKKLLRKGKREEKVKLLYVGKVNTENLKLCKKLMKEGVLIKPRYLPEVFA